MTNTMITGATMSDEIDPVAQVTTDLVAEQNALDDVVAGLDDDAWRRDTPSPGWTVADQVGHLWFFDRSATLAIADPDGFRHHRDELFIQMNADHDPTLAEARAMTPAELLAAWRDARAGLAAAANGFDAATRVEWYGPSMGARSFLTARLMEAWAHGTDIIDTVADLVGPDARPTTDRCRHIAQLGVITRGWSYANRGLTPPEGSVNVTLTAPSGDVWTWHYDDAVAEVHGPAEDFCHVVTQRRHLDDTAVTTIGDAARDWLVRAQAFAGPATDGPAPKG